MNKQLSEIQSLMDRMDNPCTLSEAEQLTENKIKANQLLSETLNELDANDREDVPINDFLDMITSRKGGSKVAFGYVSTAKLDIPKVKRRFEGTGRMRSYPDWEGWGNSLGYENVAGVLRFTMYNLNWRNLDSYNRHYVNAYKNPVNALRDKYGVERIGDKANDYTQNINYQTGMKAYGGENDELKGHTYSDQDIANKGTKINTEYYLIDNQGHIISEISVDKLKEYFSKSSPVDKSVFNKLKAQGKSDEEIEALYDQYMQERNQINYKYARFEHSSIVYMITTVDGVRKRFFNNHLVEKVGDIAINPSDFINLAKSKYNIADQTIKNEELGDYDFNE